MSEVSISQHNACNLEREGEWVQQQEGSITAEASAAKWPAKIVLPSGACETQAELAAHCKSTIAKQINQLA